jgi:beta-lactamase class A
LRIESISQKSNARAVAVALHDTESGAELHYEADRWFHGASTIKVAILLAVYGEIDRGRLVPQSRLHVRNRFLSAYDGSPFRIQADRDADSEVHAAIGKTMRVSELALHMIATSSNLATNLLLDLIGLEAVQRTIDRFGLTGLDLRRGVEDEKAFEHGIVNRVTANGLVKLLGVIAEGQAYSPQLSHDMLDILHQQEFKKGIPARLPREVRVAHKTGDISTVAHDAGVVYAPGRKAYVIAILTEWAPDAGNRSSTIASLSHAVYEHLRGEAANG